MLFREHTDAEGGKDTDTKCATICDSSHIVEVYRQAGLQYTTIVLDDAPIKNLNPEKRKVCKL